MRVSLFRTGAAILAGSAVLVLAGAAPASAQNAPTALPDRYEFVVGGFNATFRAVFGLAVSTSDDVPLVDFERDLGTPDRSTMFRGSAAVRFGKHQFRAGYYRTTQESTTQLERQIVWGDRVFDIGATVASKFNTSFPEVDYTYWLYSSRSVAVGATLGVTLFGVEAGIDAAVNNQSAAAQIDKRVPVPLLGAEFRGLPAEWMLIRGGGGYITDFSGISVWRLGAAVEPRIYKSLWLGVAFDAIKFNVEKDGSLFDLNAAGNYRVAGVHVYARIGF